MRIALNVILASAENKLTVLSFSRGPFVRRSHGEDRGAEEKKRAINQSTEYVFPISSSLSRQWLPRLS